MGKKKRTAVLDPTELKAVAKTLDKGEGADVKGIKGRQINHLKLNAYARSPLSCSDLLSLR